MIGYQGRVLSLIFYIIFIVVVVSVIAEENVTSSDVATMLEVKSPITHHHPSPLESEEFRIWIEEQEERVVQRIMEKIANPNDTSVQIEAKIAVARYLVNVTFTAMTKKLEQETLRTGKKQAFFQQTVKLPASALPATPTDPVVMQRTNETEQIINASSTTQGPSDGVLVFRGDGETSSSTSSNITSLPSTSFPLGASSSIPSSFPVVGVESAIPVSSTITEQIAVTTEMATNESETTTATPAAMQRPLWEEILNFNFSAALMGGGEGGGLLTRLMISNNNGSGSNPLMSLLNRLNLAGFGGGDAFETGSGGDSPTNDNDTLSSALPVGISSAIPASSTLTEQIAAEEQATNNGNGSETTTTATPEINQRPLWQEILNFNFSSALMGGGDGTGLLNRFMSSNNASGSDRLMMLLSRLNVTGLGGGGNGTGGGLLGRFNLTALRGDGNGTGGGLLGRFNLTALRGDGGNGTGGGLLGRFNLTALGGGGSQGGGLLGRFNLTGLGGGGGQGANILARLNFTGLAAGGGQGGNILARLNLTGLGGGGQGGNLLARFNLTGGEGGPSAIFSRFNLSSLGGGGGGGEGMGNATGTSLPFSFLPAAPEGFFYHPTPPPKNDTLRLSQMYLGNQIEKLMGNINSTNLTGIAESTLNIATPNTLGVLVNALLNIVLCNPLDRFNGNCGIE